MITKVKNIGASVYVRRKSGENIKPGATFEVEDRELEKMQRSFEIGTRIAIVQEQVLANNSGEPDDATAPDTGKGESGESIDEPDGGDGTDDEGTEDDSGADEDDAEGAGSLPEPTPAEDMPSNPVEPMLETPAVEDRASAQDTAKGEPKNTRRAKSAR